MKRIKDISLRRKICALIITRPQTFDNNVSENGMTTAIDESVKQNLKSNPACGLMMNENIHTHSSFRVISVELEAVGKNEPAFPLFIMIWKRQASLGRRPPIQP